MRIFGEVLDSDTFEPLAGVTLRPSKVEGIQPARNTITDRAGRFDIKDEMLMEETLVDFVLHGYVDKSLPVEELQGQSVYLSQVDSNQQVNLETGPVETEETTPLKAEVKENKIVPLLIIAGSAALLYLMFRKKK
jgi:hypothetical protein